jgi:hypothetical protein
LFERLRLCTQPLSTALPGVSFLQGRAPYFFRLLAMKKPLEKLIRDAAEVGVSAAMLGVEIGTRLLRSNFVIGLRVEPAAPHGPAEVPHPPRGTVHPNSDSHEAEPTQGEIERRAYERWERAGRPDGWDKEFYRMAELELRTERLSN